MTKLIIAGGRDFKGTQSDYELIGKIVKENNIDEIVSGGATGADKFGETFAKYEGLKVTKFLPQWDKYGRSAWPRRNAEMANYADAVVLFRGGAGTASMKAEATKHGIKILYEEKE